MRNGKIIIRPFSSKKGMASLVTCGLIGIAVFVAGLVISILSKNNQAVFLLSIMAGVFIILGIILFLVFPRVKLVFDPSPRNITVMSSRAPDRLVPFSGLQPFQIYEVTRGYAHQFYCRNGSLGEYSDLLFSSFHGRTVKKAKKLARLTGAALIDYDGKKISPE